MREEKFFKVSCFLYLAALSFNIMNGSHRLISHTTKSVTDLRVALAWAYTTLFFSIIKIKVTVTLSKTIAVLTSAKSDRYTKYEGS